jgi:hypothetical protein
VVIKFDRKAEWDFIQTIPAVSQDNYNVIAPTPMDSCITTGIHWTVFAIIAHTPNPYTFYVSKPDSGYFPKLNFSKLNDI